jgi:hypothetical protein
MTDLEGRLRTALHAASEQAPAGLMEAVMRRHMRHRIRVGASVLAVGLAAALAVPPVTNALSGVDRPGAGRAPAQSSHRSQPPSVPRAAAAAGTVLSGCADSNLGVLGRDWKAYPATNAGPLWFLAGSTAAGQRLGGRLSLHVAIVVLDRLRPGSVVVVRVAPGSRSDLRFLYGPKDSLNPGTRYTMRSGEPGVTFVVCSPDYTDYYGGFLVRGARCVPVRVWVPGRAHPLTTRLGVCPGP